MVVLNCRFILDLREAAAPAEYNTQLSGVMDRDTTDSSVMFRASDCDAAIAASLISDATVVWVSDDLPSTISSDVTLEIELLERMEQG